MSTLSARSLNWRVAAPVLVLLAPSCLFLLAMLSDGNAVVIALIGASGQRVLVRYGGLVGIGLSLLSAPALLWWTFRTRKTSTSTHYVLMAACLLALLPLVWAAMFTLRFGDLS